MSDMRYTMSVRTSELLQSTLAKEKGITSHIEIRLRLGGRDSAPAVRGHAAYSRVNRTARSIV